jgi:hypothetical protein
MKDARYNVISVKKDLNITILSLLGIVITLILREFSFINSIFAHFGNALGQDGERDHGA